MLPVVSSLGAVAALAAKHRGIPIVGVVIAVTIGPEQAHAQSEVHGQAVREAPVILEIRLYDFVAVVELQLIATLAEASDVSHEEVGERISSAERMPADR